MADRINLNAYLDRVGYVGSIAPTLATLEALLLGHLTAIPYETLDALLGSEPPADARAVEAKLVQGRRGGTSREHALLLAAALRDLDYPVKLHGTEVLFDGADEAVPARQHIVLSVEAGGTAYLVDAGFGSLAPPVPIRLRAGVSQATPLGTYRLSAADDGMLFELQRGEDWLPLYRFAPTTELAPEDVQPIAGAPRLLAARLEGEGRAVLVGPRLLTRAADGTIADEVTLSAAADLKEALTTRFGIRLPTAETLDAMLDSLAGVA